MFMAINVHNDDDDFFRLTWLDRCNLILTAEFRPRRAGQKPIASSFN